MTDTASIRRTVNLLATAAFLSGVAMRLCDGLLPRVASDFGITAGAAGSVVLAFALSYAAMQLVFGPVGDRFGKALVVSLAVAGCGVFSALASMAPDYEALIASRIAWGIVSAGVIPIAMAWVGDAVPFEDRQPVLARLLFGTLCGMIAGQVAGGLFADSPWGWRGAFATMSVVYVMVGAAIFLALKPHRERPAPRAPGAGLRGYRTVLGSAWNLHVLAAVFLEGIFLLGPMAYLPAMLHQRFGLSLSAASGMLALYAVGGLLYAATARKTVARLGQVRMMVWGGLVMGGGYLAWWLAPVAWPSAPVALVVGFGTYMFHNTLQTHATQMAPEARGTAVALFAFAFFIGQAAGVFLAGRIFDTLGHGAMLAGPTLALPLVGWWMARALRAYSAA